MFREKLIKKTLIKVKADIEPTSQKTANPTAKASTFKNHAITDTNREKYVAKPRPHSRKPTIDPWFDKPYEPTVLSVDSLNTMPGINRKLPIAALLGGLRVSK